MKYWRVEYTSRFAAASDVKRDVCYVASDAWDKSDAEVDDLFTALTVLVKEKTGEEDVSVCSASTVEEAEYLQEIRKEEAT